MGDTLLKQHNRFVKSQVWDGLGLNEKFYFITTLHRPRNVNQVDKLKPLIQAIIEKSQVPPLVFAVHSRTSQTLQKRGIVHPRIKKIDPYGYLERNYPTERV